MGMLGFDWISFSVCDLRSLDLRVRGGRDASICLSDASAGAFGVSMLKR